MSISGTQLRYTALSGLAALTLAGTLPVHAQMPALPASPAPVVNLEYDAQGNPTRSIRAPGVAGLGLITSHSYDRLQRLRQSTDARNGITRLDYNGRVDLNQVIDPRGLVTQSPRNGLGDTTGLLSPDTGNASHSFDAAGNLKTRVDSRGVLATHNYDALNRLTSVVYTQPGQASQVQGWFYDQTGPAFGYGLGRLTSTSYPGGSAFYGYDALGRLGSVIQQAPNSAGATVSLGTSYGYDAAGHVTSITYPSGRVVLIPHVGGLPAAINLVPSAGAAPVALLGQIQHEPFGVVGSWQWQLNTGPRAHQRVFDSSGRMVRYTLGGAVRDISYDAADRITSYTHRDLISGAVTAATTALNQSFVYDELSRLVQVSSPAGSWTYSYDANGNRLLTSSPGAGARVHTVAANSNRLLALDNPSRVLTHDAAGNTISDLQGAFGWTASVNLAGRVSTLVTRSATGTATSNYFHNNQGLRVAKWSQELQADPPPPPPPPPGDDGPPVRPPPPGDCEYDKAGNIISCSVTSGAALQGVATLYVHDPQGQLLGEYNGQTGAALREYIWLQGMPVAVLAYELGTAANPVPVFFIQTDHLDTPRVVLDRNGAQRWSWVALPFGGGSPVTNPVGLGEFELNLRMPGQYFDKESGLSQNWHRDYDAGVGRFTQSDPIGLQGGINTYAYVEGNPLSYTDPDGLKTASASRGGQGMRTTPPADQCDETCKHTITIKTNGSCAAGDTMCAISLRVAGMPGPYYAEYKTYDWLCLLKLGIGVKGTLAAGGVMAGRHGPGLAARGLSAAGAPVAGAYAGAIGTTAAEFAAGPVGITISVLGAAYYLDSECECKASR